MSKVDPVKLETVMDHCNLTSSKPDPRFQHSLFHFGSIDATLYAVTIACSVSSIDPKWKENVDI